MDEYIEREAAKKAIYSGYTVLNLKKEGAFTVGDAFEIIIDNVPAADVVPVRHGRWIQHYEPYDTGEEWIEAPYGFECSECGRWEAEKEPFCNCGAKMDKEE